MAQRRDGEPGRRGIQHRTSIGCPDRRDNACPLLLRSESLLRDDLDRQIVASLVENARWSFAEIGERVGLSAPGGQAPGRPAPGRRRHHRLTRRSSTRPRSAPRPRRSSNCTAGAAPTRPTSRRWSRAEPGIVAVYTVTGDADALLHIKTESPASLEAIVEHVRAHQNAERTKTTIVLSRVAPR